MYVKNKILSIISGVILSYGQVLFSNSFLFSFLILLVTLIQFNIGLSGLICTIFATIIAYFIGLDNYLLKKGLYSYNALLVGLGLGTFYKLSATLILILLFAAFFTLLIQIALQTFLQKHNLYVLSLPFVLCFIIIYVSLRNSILLEHFENKIFLADYYYTINSNILSLYYKITDNLPEFWILFFKSLGSIFFLDDIISGIIIFFLLLLYSRISATLSIIGFASSYLIIYHIGITDKIHTLFGGFNFILLAISVGGFFIVPSFYSYVSAFILSSMSVFITIFFNELFSLLQVSSYSIPFSVMTNIFLLFVTNLKYDIFKIVYFQEFRPEYNLYRDVNHRKRFYNILNSIPIILPFWGKWKVWQGYNDKYTHTNDYKYALDFVIEENNYTFKNNGFNLSDYYCYNQIVISPGNGYVVKILDNIKDNVIGDINTVQNWGNSIVIKHAEHLYSQISHLKENSFLVKEGDYVYAGQPIARVGNSGRSPQPHLHFQIQPFPIIGAKPINYPFVRYKKYSKTNINTTLHKYSIPNKNDEVENVTINLSLSNAFKFLPGMEFVIKYNNNNYQIAVFTDSLNVTYLYCSKTKSMLYIYNDYYAHYFTNYIGKKSSPLYILYLSCFNIEFSNVNNCKTYDEFPIHHILSKTKLFIHDFISPFYLLKRAEYYSEHQILDNNDILIKSSVTVCSFARKKQKYAFETIVKDSKIKVIINKLNNKSLTFEWKE
ncbi:MAG: urea transporter [Bacteroidales bacterium]|nr:urea transporter [Bacteroidales bacterium]